MPQTKLQPKSSNKYTPPAIYRWYRPVMAGIASIGAVVTAYLTYSKLTGSSTACPIEGCNIVLASPYASVFGLPLALFGFLAYASIILLAVAPMLLSKPEQRRRREDVDHWTGLLLFIGATAMMIFSGYLMFLLIFAIKALCLYCMASALFSVTLFVLSIVGRDWEDVSQLFFTGIFTTVAIMLVSLGLYSTVNVPAQAGQAAAPAGQVAQPAQSEFAVTTSSGESEIALAKHLSESGAKFYGAFWCPHCQKQKATFGKEAMEFVPYIECSPPDRNGQTAVCQAAKIEGYPTWDINGQRSTGEKSLTDLADLTGYQGPRDFKNPLPPA